MCLTIEIDAQPSIATKNISVRKLVKVYWNGKIVSPYNYFEWTIGKEEVTEMKISDDGYPFDSKEMDDYESMGYFGVNYIGEGFHSAGSTKRLKLTSTDHTLSIMQCTIPKGAMYYHNKSDLYVSDRLIPVKLLKTK